MDSCRREELRMIGMNLGEIHVILLYDRNGVHGAEGDEVVSGEGDY